MTENVTTEAQPTREEVIAALPVTYQALASVNLDMLDGFAATANKAATAVAAQENVETTIQDLIDNSDDKELAEFRTWREEREAEILAAEKDAREYVTKNLLADVDSVDPEEALTQWKSTKAEYDSLIKFMRNAPVDMQPVIDLAPAIQNMGRSRGSSATGVRRPRVSRIEYRVVGTDTWTESFTEHKKDNMVTRTVGFPALSSNLKEVTGTKLDSGSLIQEADKSAGTDSWVSLKGKPFTFTVSTEPVGDKPHLVEVRVTPKASDPKPEGAVTTAA